MLRDTMVRGLASGGLNWTGPWVDGTTYVVNDLVEHNGSSYVAIQNHIASLATEPGVGASWETVWDLVAAKGADGATGADGADGVDGVFDSCDQLILEMEMEFKTSFLCNYKEFGYNAEKQLIDIDIYSDATANLKLFHKDLTYNAEKQLIQTDLTRISDSALLVSVFTYSGDKNLISIERSGYCLCP